MTEPEIFAEPLTRTRLHEEIAGVIEGKIIRGEIQPGTRLPSERELALSFGVNRATVREAIRRLETHDLLEIQHGNGVYVKDFAMNGNLELIKSIIAHGNGSVNKDIFFSLIEARNTLCTEMAGLAAKRRTEKDLAEIGKVIQDSYISIQEKDLLVHQLIAKFTRNILYIILLNFFNQTYRDLSYLYFNNEKNVKRTEKFHKDIFKAINNSDVLRARSIMKEILEFTENATREYLNKTQEPKL
jgi:GntR family transcriptional regulator, transcriptional repressor for pyruvate dehydrogenase complex